MVGGQAQNLVELEASLAPAEAEVEAVAKADQHGIPLLYYNVFMCRL